MRLGYQRFGSSSYKRTQVSLRRAFRNNFEIGGHYTWSKSIDTTTDKSSSNGNDSATGNGNFTVRDLKLDRAVSRFDTPHRVVIFSVVDLPFGNGQRGLRASRGSARWWAAGSSPPTASSSLDSPWVSPAAPASAGLTWSATPCFPRSNRCYGPQTCALPDGDSVYVGVGRMLYFNPKAFRNRVVQYGPGAGANAGTYTGDIYYYGTTPRAFSNLRGWGVANTDISVTRTFRLTERASLLFRADAMNLFNRVSFGDGGIDKNFGSTYLPTTAAGVARAGESISSTFGTLSIRTAGMTSRLPAVLGPHQFLRRGEGRRGDAETTSLRVPASPFAGSPHPRTTPCPESPVSPSRRVTASRVAGHRVTASPGHRVAASPSRRVPESPRHRVAVSPRHRVAVSRVAVSPCRRVPASPSRRVAASPCRRIAVSPRLR